MDIEFKDMLDRIGEMLKMRATNTSSKWKAFIYKIFNLTNTGIFSFHYQPFERLKGKDPKYGMHFFRSVFCVKKIPSDPLQMNDNFTA